VSSTASNVLQFDNQTTTTSTQNVCGSCGIWYYGYHQCPTISWYPSYPVIQNDEVRELKAWLEGFMESRKMTESNLKKIQDKLEEFCT